MPNGIQELPAGTFALHVAGVFVDGRPAHIHSHPLRCPSSSHNGSTWIRLSAVHTPGKDSQRQLSLAESVEDLPHPSCRSGVDTHTHAHAHAQDSRFISSPHIRGKCKVRRSGGWYCFEENEEIRQGLFSLFRYPDKSPKPPNSSNLSFIFSSYIIANV